VDALRPEILHEIINKEIYALIDEELFLARLEKEDADKKKLERFRKAGEKDE